MITSYFPINLEEHFGRHEQKKHFDAKRNKKLDEFSDMFNCNRWYSRRTSINQVSDEWLPGEILIPMFNDKLDYETLTQIWISRDTFMKCILLQPQFLSNLYQFLIFSRFLFVSCQKRLKNFNFLSVSANKIR